MATYHKAAKKDWSNETEITEKEFLKLEAGLWAYTATENCGDGYCHKFWSDEYEGQAPDFVVWERLRHPRP